jgi:hypothetical protein
MSVVQFGAVPCSCVECQAGPSAVGAPHSGGHHHLPPALKAHEYKNKPGNQSHQYPETVNFAGVGKATFEHS